MGGRKAGMAGLFFLFTSKRIDFTINKRYPMSDFSYII